VGAFGAVALGALPLRYDDPLVLALFGIYVVALILLMATDLDQRLLPDVVTYPLIALALVALVSGVNPLVVNDIPGAVAAAVVFPAREPSASVTSSCS
jgi:prepilin signal peptidase PulO-like enzyme (type II secretory pathway)